MPELRLDALTGQWVIFAPERAGRPNEFSAGREQPLPSVCPFCAGHEHLMPRCLAEVPAEGSPGAPGATGTAWAVRVVPNKFPALVESPDSASPYARQGHELFVGAAGAGRHEVVVESPRHVTSFGELTDHEASASVRIYRDRLRSMRNEGRWQAALAFKNCGPGGGASLAHVHSQIVALPFVPPVLAAEVAGAAALRARTGTCAYCQLVAQELAAGERIVATTPDFVALCPFASRLPYEVWILPRRHASAFELEDDTLPPRLALVLRQVVRQFERTLANPPYNFVFHTAPFQETNGHFHWHVELFPRLAPLAGFEWGTGTFINSVLPETAATRLRGEMAR